MSEAPIIYFGIGFLLAALVLFGATSLLRSRVGRLARKRLEAAAPRLMAEIEADMGELHAQIAMATRRLEVSVEQMKTRTAGQLSEIGRSSEAIARLKAEHGERTIALQALDTRERDVMAFVNARDQLVETERRHAAAMEQLRKENQSLEEQLGQSYDEITRLEQEMTTLKRQVEAIWASERMANAVLRERINDVAGEVVRVAHALEGLGSPIETMLVGKASELDLAIGTLTAGNVSIPPSNGGDETKGSLARRIRAMQKRAARVASAGGL
jgi:chromosome segregation ATPase